MEFQKKSGYLELIIGPMFSGKTSKLLEIYKQCKYCNIPVAVINHSLDNRYHSSMLSTHDKNMIPCIQSAKLKELELNEEIQNADVLLINEGQFFEDLVENIEKWLNENKKIYISGLDGDFERKKFGPILDLIPICDKVEKLNSLCGICKDGTRGVFSLRTTQEKKQTLIGSSNYIPVCRFCYQQSTSLEIPKVVFLKK